MEQIGALLGGPTSSIAFAIFSGVIGFFAKGIYDLRTARRKDRLDRVSQQLRELYGPLYALNQADRHAWDAFRKRVRPGETFFHDQPPPSAHDLESWRLWMNTVFRPHHDEMMAIITRNADLLIEADLPKALQLFCGHVASYKGVFAKWDKGDFSEHKAVINYPWQELDAYLEHSFKYLKTRQAGLLGQHDKA